MLDWEHDQLCPPWYPGHQEYSVSASRPIPNVVGCLSHTRGSLYRIGYNVPFLTIIIGCLAIRTAVILAGLFILRKGGPRILTVGDAVANFLETEELSVKNYSLFWTPDSDWRCINGPLSTYPLKHSPIPAMQKRKGWLRRRLRIFSKRYNESSDIVPKYDVVGFAHTMKFHGREG